MGDLRFRYRTAIHFSSAVQSHFYTLRIIPPNNNRQQVLSLHVDVDHGEKTESLDAYGNHMIIGSIPEPHTAFHFLAEGCVRVLKDQYENEDNCPALYKYPTPLTGVSSDMRSCINHLKAEKGYADMNQYDIALDVMTQIYNMIDYVPGTTNVDTRAAEAWKMRQGVCQDYAHIMLCFLREYQIPARYVAGMMLGEGFTHAWVEACIDGKWYGFDPTNNHVVDDTYIVLAHGRDYKSCCVSRGHFTGMADQNQIVELKVEEMV